jgi:tRNA G18 (ribose-2'-O)-methylase SpoU
MNLAFSEGCRKFRAAPMSKSSREHVYGLNPAFEVLRAGKRRVYSAHLNEGMRDNTRVKKLLGVLERGNVEIEWTDKGRLMQISSACRAC